MHLKIVRNRIFVVRIVHNFRHDVEPWLVDDLFKSELKKLMKDKKNLPPKLDFSLFDPPSFTSIKPVLLLYLHRSEYLATGEVIC